MNRALFSLTTALLLAIGATGCGDSAPPPPETDPAKLKQMEADLKNARAAEAKAAKSSRK